MFPSPAATVPGFGEVDARHYKQFNTSYTHTFSSNVINEFRIGYTRINYGAVQPQKSTQARPSVGFQINSQNHGVRRPACHHIGWHLSL